MAALMLIDAGVVSPARISGELSPFEQTPPVRAN
jgi:hypothetical protein